MSALGNMIRDYEQTIDNQDEKLREIKKMAESCFQMDNAPTMEEAILKILAIVHGKKE
ncbi:hypothetical protein [Bacillus sp. M6-12]|uniref:hypothetical protein n=1 Tax=Bacillus sp. M6-12 TaxID=2054166 RepID=UPI0015E07346|nr:hypothetical protein [Bacillus sp. M6-12]